MPSQVISESGRQGSIAYRVHACAEKAIDARIRRERASLVPNSGVGTVGSQGE
jgi:hypothetical protein